MPVMFWISSFKLYKVSLQNGLLPAVDETHGWQFMKNLKHDNLLL